MYQKHGWKHHHKKGIFFFPPLNTKNSPSNPAIQQPPYGTLGLFQTGKVFQILLHNYRKENSDSL